MRSKSTVPYRSALRPGTRRALGGSVAALLLAAALLPAGALGQTAGPVAFGPVSSLAATPGPSRQLRLGLSERTQLVYEPPRVAVPGLDLTDPAKAKLGLEFRSPDTHQKLRGALRVQLTGDSMVQFRPRSRGLEIVYRAQF